MILYKTDAEVELMKKSARLVSQTLTEVATMLKPGVTTFQIDRLCAEFIRDHKAIPSFLNYRGYPFTICASVNDVVVHGFPNNQALKDGDVVSIDFGVILNGWHGDHAYTFLLGEAGEDVLQLMRVTKESLYKGIEKAVAGNGPRLKENATLAIEPMINMGTKDVYTEDDGWTVRTRDGKPSVHFEHDVCVKKNRADILSNYAPIEAAEKANSNL